VAGTRWYPSNGQLLSERFGAAGATGYHADGSVRIERAAPLDEDTLLRVRCIASAIEGGRLPTGPR